MGDQAERVTFSIDVLQVLMSFYLRLQDIHDFILIINYWQF